MWRRGARRVSAGLPAHRLPGRDGRDGRALGGERQDVRDEPVGAVPLRRLQGADAAAAALRRRPLRQRVGEHPTSPDDRRDVDNGL